MRASNGDQLVMARQLRDAAGPSAKPTLRNATAEDLPEIAAIYRHHVLTGTGSFEELPPSLDEMRARFERCAAWICPTSWPCSARRWRAFGYAGPFRPRSAYRFTSRFDLCGAGPGAAGASAAPCWPR